MAISLIAALAFLVGLAIFILRVDRQKASATSKQVPVLPVFEERKISQLPVLPDSEEITVLPVSEERKVFLRSKETVRRALKNPADAKFYAPYPRGLNIISNDVADVSDANEVAKRFHTDYWISFGLVDAYAKIGNKQRIEWIVVLDEQSTDYALVYSQFGEQKEGTLPTLSKLEKLTKDRETLQKQFETEKIKQLALKEQAVRIQKYKEEQKRQINEKIQEFRETQARVNLHATSNTPVVDVENDPELRQLLAKRMLVNGVYVDWKTNTVSQMRTKELEWFKQQDDLKFMMRSFGSGLGR